jgi:hypothetical protein
VPGADGGKGGDGGDGGAVGNGGAAGNGGIGAAGKNGDNGVLPGQPGTVGLAGGTGGAGGRGGKGGTTSGNGGAGGAGGAAGGGGNGGNGGTGADAVLDGADAQTGGSGGGGGQGGTGGAGGAGGTKGGGATSVAGAAGNGGAGALGGNGGNGNNGGIGANGANATLSGEDGQKGGLGGDGGVGGVGGIGGFGGAAGGAGASAGIDAAGGNGGNGGNAGTSGNGGNGFAGVNGLSAVAPDGQAGGAGGRGGNGAGGGDGGAGGLGAGSAAQGTGGNGGNGSLGGLGGNGVGTSGVRADVAVETAGSDAFTTVSIANSGASVIGLEKASGSLSPTAITIISRAPSQRPRAAEAAVITAFNVDAFIARPSFRQTTDDVVCGPFDFPLPIGQTADRIEQLGFFRLFCPFTEDLREPARPRIHAHLQRPDHLQFGELVDQRLLARFGGAAPRGPFLLLLLLALRLLERGDHLLEARNDVLDDAPGGAADVTAAEAGGSLRGVVPNLLECLRDRHGRTVVADERQRLDGIGTDRRLFTPEPRRLQLPRAFPVGRRFGAMHEYLEVVLQRERLARLVFEQASGTPS